MPDNRVILVKLSVNAKNKRKDLYVHVVLLSIKYLVKRQIFCVDISSKPGVKCVKYGARKCVHPQADMNMGSMVAVVIKIKHKGIVELAVRVTECPTPSNLRRGRMKTGLYSRAVFRHAGM